MKFLICDDHKVVRDGVINALKPLLGIEYISEANDGKQALDLLEKKEYDIVFMDISLPKRSGLDYLIEIKSKWPSVKVIMLSMHPEEVYGLRCLKNGASGYLNKDVNPDQIREAVNLVAHGKPYISPNLASILAENLNQSHDKKPHEKLSDREFEIMLMLARGKSYSEIGVILGISEKTIGTYKGRITDKTGIKKNSGLTQYCIENGLMKL
jgi:DNA-binding NarL/FixJ family response regulator